MDKVRVILTNDNCHTDLVPDVIARRIDEKINSMPAFLDNAYVRFHICGLRRRGKR